MNTSFLTQLYNRYGTIFGAISVLSFSSVTLQISIMRIASALYVYHYAFVAISIALLGIGFGALVSNKLEIIDTSINEILMELTAISALSVLGLLFLILYAFQVAFYIFLLFIVLPFFFLGFAFGIIYKMHSQFSNHLYLWDLVGASLGSILAIVFLTQFKVINTMIGLTLLLSICSIRFALLSQSRRRLMIGLVMFLLVSTFFFLTLETKYGSFAEGEEKELQILLADQNSAAKIIDSRWGLYGRTDLVELKDDPYVKLIFTDGGAATRMYRFDGDLDNLTIRVSQLKNSSVYFPFCFENHKEILVIGAGGGMDVLIALMAGADQIDAIEVNADIVDMVREYATYNGGLYTQYDEVQLFIDEGRSFIRRYSRTYDIILLNLPVTRTSQGLSACALAENYLFTINAFSDYLDKLDTDGRIVIRNHVLQETYKVLFTALTAFNERSIDIVDAMQQVVIIEQTSNDRRTFPLFILKKTAFTEAEITAMYAKTIALGLVPIYFPGISSNYPFFDALSSGETSVNNAILQLSTTYDLSPSTDDKPFFYKLELGIPFTILTLLLFSAIISILLLMYFLKDLHQRIVRPRKRLIFFALYFSILGLAFMVTEVSLMQRLILFLGHPTWGMAIFLFSLLLSSGVGGLLSLKITKGCLQRALTIISVIGVLLIVFYSLLLPLIIEPLLSQELLLRSLMTLILVFPIGFLSGIPFPCGLFILKKEGEYFIPWMWCINGVFSFIGSTLAIAFALIQGFSYALLASGVAYLSLFLIGKIHTSRFHFGARAT